MILDCRKLRSKFSCSLTGNSSPADWPMTGETIWFLQERLLDPITGSASRLNNSSSQPVNIPRRSLPCATPPEPAKSCYQSLLRQKTFKSAAESFGALRLDSALICWKKLSLQLEPDLRTQSGVESPHSKRFTASPPQSANPRCGSIHRTNRRTSWRRTPAAWRRNNPDWLAGRCGNT